MTPEVRTGRGGGAPPLRPVVLAVAVRPWLWPVALRLLSELAPRRWWRRPPFLPRPDPSYLAFRVQTMYGDPAHEPVASDVVRYLQWVRRYRTLAR